MGSNNDMKALGKFKHSGVVVHPNDYGMENIATRLLQPFMELVK